VVWHPVEMTGWVQLAGVLAMASIGGLFLAAAVAAKSRTGDGSA